MKRAIGIHLILPFILLLAILLTVGGGLAAAQGTYTDSDNGKTILVKGGDTFTVRLEENPSTGYSWNLTVGNGLRLVKDRYVPGTTSMIGSGGIHEWTIKAIGNGTSGIAGIYKRPWEPGSGGDKRFSMTIKVVGKPCIFSLDPGARGIQA